MFIGYWGKVCAGSADRPQVKYDTADSNAGACGGRRCYISSGLVIHLVLRTRQQNNH